MKSLIGTFVFLLAGGALLTWLTGGSTSEVWILRLITYGLWVTAAFYLIFIVGDWKKLRRQKKQNTR